MKPTGKYVAIVTLERKKIAVEFSSESAAEDYAGDFYVEEVLPVFEVGAS